MQTQSLQIRYFNPLPRKEGDLKRGCCVIRAFWISIHSLVKRETFLTSLPFLSYFDFNPLPRKEGDPSRTDLHRAVGDFNPLPRKEGDPSRTDLHRAVGDFNPLPRKEGDQKRNDHGDCQKRFQSTPS